MPLSRARTRLAALITAVGLLTLAVGVAPAAASVPTITGHVGSPAGDVAGLLIQAAPTGGGTTFNGTTLADGTYVIEDVPNGEYDVQIYDPTDVWKNVDNHHVTIAAATPTAVVDFTLAPWPVGTSLLAGTVFDSATHLGIPGVVVHFNGFGTARDDLNTSDSTGGFHFSGIPGGIYSVSAVAAGYVPGTQVLTIDDADSIIVNLTLVPANATISGTVTDGTNPVPDGLPVRYFLDGNTSIQGSVTTAGGAYSFPSIGAGNYTVKVGGPGTAWNLSTQAVVAVASTTVTANFVLSARVSSAIKGTIWNAAHTATLAGICVGVYDSTGTAVAGAHASASDGLYDIGDVEAGTYRLFFWDCDNTRSPQYAMTFSGPSTNLAHATSITLAGGVDSTGNDALLALGGTISGHIDVQAADGVVPFPSGRSMDATIFQLVDGTWEPMPDPNPFVGCCSVGDYDAGGLPAGTYRVGFIDSFPGTRGYAIQFYDGAITLDTAQDVVVGAGAAVTGIDATVYIPHPFSLPFFVPTADLTPAEEGHISSAASAQQGGNLTVQLDPKYAGEWISVWGHSDPVLLGDWVQVSSAGKVTVPIPTTLPTGNHQLVAQDSDGNVIGWTPIAIAAAAPGTTALARTGQPTNALLVPFGAALLLVGAGSLALVRRRRVATRG